MRVALEERLGVANEIIDDESAKARDRLGALAFLARIGLGGKREGITVDAELLNQFFAVIGRHVTDTDALAEIREAWLDILAERVGT